LTINTLKKQGRETGMSKKSTYQPLKQLAVLLAMGLLIFAAVPADAQGGGGRGGPRLTSEESEAAWTLEAEGVANDIGASDGETAKVVAAYIAARTSQSAAMREARQAWRDEGGGGGGRGNFQALREITTKERDSLQAALGMIVSADKAATATESLGTFNRQWDMMAITLAAFGLAEEKQNACLTTIANYVVSADKARSEAFANQDFQSFRTISQEQKSALDTLMAKQLSEEQLVTWKEKTARRGFGGGRGGGQRN
jgi:hypothetical protein